jgi:cell division protease FtsH
MSDDRSGRTGSKLKQSERTTRKPLIFWDRIKIVLLLVSAWLVLLWSVFAEFPFIPARDAIRINVSSHGWLLLLASVECIRQLHYLIAEHSPAYYAFWNRAFGKLSSSGGGLDDWTRFRLGRITRLVFFLIILDFILAAVYHLSPATALFQVPVIIFAALPFVLQLGFGFMFVMLQFVGLFWFLSRGGVDTYMPDDIETRYSDVKGQDAVLERVKENVIFLEDPEAIEQRGGYVPGGILLWGPPGTGKTLMARAVAGETGRPFVSVEPGAFINMFMGVGILKVRGLYRKLRKLALRYGGVIVFLDEADSLGNRGAMGGGGGAGGWGFEGSVSPWTTGPTCNGLSYVAPETRTLLMRTALGTALPEGAPRREGIIAGLGGMGGGGMGTLQALLSEMDGLKKPRGFVNRVVRRLLGMKPKTPPKYRILHMFATNQPQVLDDAMLRPGRIDRIYKVGYPSKEGRKSTYEYYLSKVSHELTEEHLEKLATITPYATGATIQDTVNEALVIAIRDGRSAIEWRDIIHAKRLKEHGLPDDTEYVERERHAVALHEAAHAVAAYRTRRHMVIDIATIERRGDIGGFVSSIPPEDQFVHWRSEREADIMVSLASLVGERMFFDGDNSAGVGGDMRSATGVATLMEGYSAMGETIASHGVTKFALTAGRGAYSAEDGTDRNFLETELGRRVETKLKDLYDRTGELLEQNRSAVLAVAHALETHKTVTGDDVVAIIEGREGPFIDGRQYHDPVFAAELEAYHAAALTAHKSHSTVEGSMPALVPPPPPGVLAPAAGNGSGNGQPVAPQPGAPPMPRIRDDVERPAGEGSSTEDS